MKTNSKIKTKRLEQIAKSTLIVSHLTGGKHETCSYVTTYSIAEFSDETIQAEVQDAISKGAKIILNQDDNTVLVIRKGI